MWRWLSQWSVSWHEENKRQSSPCTDDKDDDDDDDEDEDEDDDDDDAEDDYD